jgi:phosphonopyruvate decarboxylase
MAGSMGHALGIGLGMAIGRPERRVVVLDGDGALLMHMGTLSNVGHHAPANLVHVVLDNGTYGSTGDQPATSSSTDLVAAARSCGYRATYRCRDAEELAGAFSRALAEPGPAFLRAMIGTAAGSPAPRVTAMGSLDSQAARFRAAILDGA